MKRIMITMSIMMNDEMVSSIILITMVKMNDRSFSCSFLTGIPPVLPFFRIGPILFRLNNFCLIFQIKSTRTTADLPTQLDHNQ